MKNYFKKTVMALLVMAMIVTFLPIEKMQVQAATTTGCVPITCYTMSTGRTNTYNLSNGRYTYTGYIDGATDRCTIQEVRSDGYVRVKYPVSGGRYRTAYAPSSAFFVNTNFSTKKMQLGTSKTAYRRSNLSQSLGTVYANDQVIVVGYSNNNTQVIYPVSGGYKMGWVSGKYSPQSDNTGSADIKAGYYQIKCAANQNMVLDVRGASTEDGATIQIYQNAYQTNQGFLIKSCGDGYYTITAIHSGKNLDVANSGQKNETKVLQWTAHNGDNQKWKIVKTSDNFYSFISKCNGLYLDVGGAVFKNQTHMQVYEGNNTIAQKFVLAWVSVDGQEYNQNSDSGISNSSDKIQQIVNYELSQLGVGDYRGNNNVVYNTWYYGHTVSGSGKAWCMAFQSYCANQIGVLDSAIPKTASCASAVSWYRQRGQFQLSASHGGNYTPKAGDLVFYGSNGSSHVGMIIAAPVNGYLQVVEGNVRAGNGNYTVQKFTRNTRRRVDSSYVYGYATPSY